MVPGAYWPEKLTVCRRTGLEPPLKPLKKDPNGSVSCARTGPDPASIATAINSKAKARIIMFLAR